MKKIKLIAYLAVFALVIGAGYYAFEKFDFLPNPFKSQPVIIAETPVVVQEIKNMAELYSTCYYDEVVLEAKKNEETIIDQSYNLVGSIIGAKKSTTKRSLVLIAKGRIYGGFDLRKLDESNIEIKDKNLIVKIDEPKILDIVINPSDHYTFIENGTWSTKEVNSLLGKAKEKLRSRAIKKGILQKTKERGINSITSFFKGLGFQNVQVVILK